MPIETEALTNDSQDQLMEKNQESKKEKLIQISTTAIISLFFVFFAVIALPVAFFIAAKKEISNKIKKLDYHKIRQEKDKQEAEERKINVIKQLREAKDIIIKWEQDLERKEKRIKKMPLEKQKKKWADLYDEAYPFYSRSSITKKAKNALNKLGGEIHSLKISSFLSMKQDNEKEEEKNKIKEFIDYAEKEEERLTNRMNKKINELQKKQEKIKEKSRKPFTRKMKFLDEPSNRSGLDSLDNNKDVDLESDSEIQKSEALEESSNDNIEATEDKEGALEESSSDNIEATEIKKSKMDKWNGSIYEDRDETEANLHRAIREARSKDYTKEEDRDSKNDDFYSSFIEDEKIYKKKLEAYKKHWFGSLADKKIPNKEYRKSLTSSSIKKMKERILRGERYNKDIVLALLHTMCSKYIASFNGRQEKPKIFGFWLADFTDFGQIKKDGSIVGSEEKIGEALAEACLSPYNDILFDSDYLKNFSNLLKDPKNEIIFLIPLLGKKEAKLNEKNLDLNTESVFGLAVFRFYYNPDIKKVCYECCPFSPTDDIENENPLHNIFNSPEEMTELQMCVISMLRIMAKNKLGLPEIQIDTSSKKEGSLLLPRYEVPSLEHTESDMLYAIEQILLANGLPNPQKTQTDQKPISLKQHHADLLDELIKKLQEEEKEELQEESLAVTSSKPKTLIKDTTSKNTNKVRPVGRVSPINIAG